METLTLNNVPLWSGFVWHDEIEKYAYVWFAIIMMGHPQKYQRCTVIQIIEKKCSSFFYSKGLGWIKLLNSN